MIDLNIKWDGLDYDVIKKRKECEGCPYHMCIPPTINYKKEAHICIYRYTNKYDEFGDCCNILNTDIIESVSIEKSYKVKVTKKKSKKDKVIWRKPT